MDTAAYPWLNLPDLIAAGLLLVGAIGGLRRGLSGELSRLVALVLSFAAAWYGHAALIPHLGARLAWSADALAVASFASVFFGVYAVLKLVRFAVHTILDISFRGPIERVGGVALGLFRYALAVALLFLLAGQLPSRTVAEQLETSRVYALVQTHLQPKYDALAEDYPILRRPENGSETLYEDLQSEPWDALEAWLQDQTHTNGASAGP